jgi:hypothetical protein
VAEVVPTVIGESRRIGYAHYGRRLLKYYEVALLYSKPDSSGFSYDCRDNFSHGRPRKQVEQKFIGKVSDGYAHYGRRLLKYYEVALLYSKYSRSPESEDG